MLTYIAVFVVVVLVLYGSFRALGGGAPVAPDDYRTVLERLSAFTIARADELDRVLSDPPPLIPSADSRKPVDPLAETAGTARKALTGYQQQLGRIETEADGEERESLLSARSLLSAAIEDYGWACRMIETGTYRENPGVQAAVEVLRRHARDCLGATRDLVASDLS